MAQVRTTATPPKSGPELHDPVMAEPIREQAERRRQEELGAVERHAKEAELHRVDFRPAVLVQAGEVVAQEAAGQTRAEPERERPEEDETERTLHRPLVRVAARRCAPAPIGRWQARLAVMELLRTPHARWSRRPSLAAATAPSSLPTTSRPPPVSACCGPAVPRSTRPSPRTPRWPSSCRTAAGSVATRSGSSGTPPRVARRHSTAPGGPRRPRMPAPGGEAGISTVPLIGPRSITTPGAVRSWGAAHVRHGRLSREAILAPAIELAAGGFPAWDGYIEAVEVSAERYAASDDLPDRGAGWASVHRPNGRRWRPGEVVRLPALARSLTRLATAGFDDLYEGELAARQCVGLAAAGSPITAADLRAQGATWEEPIGIDYRGVRATSHPPNSSGVIALEILGAAGPLRTAATERLRPGRRRRRPLDPHRPRGLQAGDGRPRRAPGRPGAPTIPRAGSCRTRTSGRWRPASTKAVPRRRPKRSCPVAAARSTSRSWTARGTR